MIFTSKLQQSSVLFENSCYKCWMKIFNLLPVDIVSKVRLGSNVELVHNVPLARSALYPEYAITN
eukprot:5518856-Amphidinium_carterae.1